MTATPVTEDVLRRFAAAVRSGQLYAEHHPIVGRNITALLGAIERFHQRATPLVIGVVGDEIVVGDVPVATGDGHAGFVRRLKAAGFERVVIDRGVAADELKLFVTALNRTEPGGSHDHPFPALAHVRVGKLNASDQDDAEEREAVASFRRLYDDAVSAANVVWSSAAVERHPDVTAAKSLVDGLAHAVSQNRSALLALTTLKNYDNYTFTHMVNVSILTMGQARALGINGPLLREIGLAALMHDIGKVRTPLEILNKPEKLTDGEFEIMKRHPVDGAEILRSTPDMPALAPIVALEHHRRLDGTGYPNITRHSLNLGTSLCAISDVYDAMRSQRAYQQAFPSDRIVAVLRRNDGRQFDQHLTRRFVQLIGIYPPGALVKLDTGHLAVVVRVHALDPYRPQVKIVTDELGAKLHQPYELNLWEKDVRDGRPRTVAAPVDPSTIDVDTLALL